jgi:hypothetical protein
VRRQPLSWQIIAGRRLALALGVLLDFDDLLFCVAQPIERRRRWRK